MDFVRYGRCRKRPSLPPSRARPVNNTNLIIAALIIAILVSVGSTTFSHMRERQRADRARRIARLRDQLHNLDDVREAIAALPVEPRLRQLFGDHRDALCAALAQMDETRPVAPPLPAEGAISALASHKSLARALTELNAARRYLQELERAGRLSRSERLQFADSLAHTAVVLQVESLATWAELPGTEHAVAESYLRDAQHLLHESIHLDSEFTTRIAGLRSRQQAIARGSRDNVASAAAQS